MATRFVHIVAAGISVVVTCEILYYVIKKYRESRKRVKTTREDVNEVIFFPDTSVVSVKNSNNGHNSLSRLMRHLGSAERSLDLCLYIFSCSSLRKTVEKVHAKGVRVRLIVDESQSDASGSQIGVLRARGIWVRTSKFTPYLMHHKFAVVDGRLLINGSLNWTRQAIVGNQENVLVTSNSDVVRQYVDEFERLWQLYDPRNKNFKI